MFMQLFGPLLPRQGKDADMLPDHPLFDVCRAGPQAARRAFPGPGFPTRVASRESPGPSEGTPLGPTGRGNGCPSQFGSRREHVGGVRVRRSRGWSSCRAWMQDFVNAILRPVSSESWPPSAGPPASASFRVAFRGSCRLPPDILTRSGVPCSPPSLPLQGGGDAASAERRHSHSPDGDVVMTPAGSGPPVRLKVSRVSLSRRWDDRPNRPTRNHSRERVSPSPSARGHSSPLAVAPQRSPRRVSRRADPDWPGPAPAPIGAAQSWRECAESRGESGSFKDSCEGSERSVQI
ncbi:unnamed protein product [Prorocentrum cordatum]|uniref:Uncharacterized protein n=1 Tax=Prorocentrum cordatum TaxID=2364126 RepID=A0ABN9TBK3_9DINO|nr:unnamed protein product [Polarella glacialis]